MFKLQSNVPLPKTIRPTQQGRRRKYPFETMTVGSFFFVPGFTTRQINGHVSVVARQLNMKLSTRLCYMARDAADSWQRCEKNDKGAVLGVGVWRTA